MNAKLKVRDFTMHGTSGLSIPHDKWVSWVIEHQNEKGFSPENNYGLGRISHHSWFVNNDKFEISNEQWIYSYVLPDATGFIGFEQNRWENDNCVLFDVYGKERTRLTVPWQLTRQLNPKSAKPPTSFNNISDPYINPENGKQGVFGVTAWVEYAGKYYFELDYHTGTFLWGTEIRD